MRGYRISRQIIITVVSLLIWSTGIAFSATAGDVNTSGGIDLQDTILSLQISVGMTPSADLSADVDGDGKISLAEAIFALRTVSESSGGPTYSLGDSGIPADYDQTVLDLSRLIDDYDTFVDKIPPNFDWRDRGIVSPPKNQGSCGSCWAFTSIGVVESKIRLRDGSEYDLSEQQQVSCNKEMGGCMGGDANALRFWTDIGPIQENCAAYSLIPPPCSDYNSCDTLPYRTGRYYTVNTDNRNEIKSSLSVDGPAYFRFNVYADFEAYWNTGSQGAVYRNESGIYMGGGHAVLLIGWDDSKNAWLCRNSWGPDTGPNRDGTFWMAYGGHVNDLEFGMANITLAADFGLTSPNGGETWERGKHYTIQWDAGDADKVKIDLYRGGSFLQTITQSTDNDGLYTWTVPDDLAAGDDYRIRITETDEAGKSDESDGVFSILTPLQVISPNGGESWQIGSRYDIRWETGSDSNPVNIYLFKEGEGDLRRLAERIDNLGTWSWYVPDTLREGSDYRIFVKMYTDESVFDKSDGLFSISFPPVPAPANLAASDGTDADRVFLSWDTSAGAGYYRVFRNTEQNSGSAAAISEWQSGTAYTDASVASGTTYYYWVKAARTMSGDGASSFSVSDSGYAQGCTYTISPQSQSFSDAGGTGTIQITAPDGCAWSASTGQDWITIDSGSSGTGSGSVSYSIMGNWKETSRTGSISIAGKTFPISQSGNSDFDWSRFNWQEEGIVAPAGNVGSCGSIWAFASVGAIASKITMMGGPQYNLSEQQLISCDTSMSGCLGGNAAAPKYFIDHGPMLESCTGYASDPDQVTCEEINHCQELPYRVEEYYTVDGSNISQIKNSILNDGPAYFRFDFYSDFYDFWTNGTSGAFYTHSSGNKRGGHAFLLIGWDDTKGAWLCQNFWGATAGPNGDGTCWIAYSGHQNDLNFGFANVTIKAVK